MKTTPALVLALLCVVGGCTRNVETTDVDINVIPLPAQMTLSGGVFSGETPARYLIDPTVSPDNPEGYELVVDKDGITAKAPTEAGLFYAEQTVRQLITPEGVPMVEITDAPRLPYRGLHLDVSRTFFGKEYILKLLDAMAYYKLNRFHWHLTDGAGWRIQIDKYPLLTKMAAFRSPSGDGRSRRFVPEGTPGAEGGYYTKDEMREVVAYAAERHITVIPEFEMPGHSAEVFVAYPNLTCSGQAYRGGDFCIGNPDTFTFVEDVLTEIMEIFPSTYIHIGGDEASKQAWKTCPKCQALMAREGLKNVDQLQSYMIRRVEKFLNSHGRKLIGWDEILQGGIAPDATVMSWRDEMEGYKAARMGHDVVMTPQNYLYFDFYQTDPTTQPYAIGGHTTVKWVYSFDPAPADSLDAAARKHVIGVQGNTWTTYIPTQADVEYMQWPRALSVAEVGWTPQEKRDWQDFKPRMNHHVGVLRDQMGFNAFPLSYDIDYEMTVDTEAREIRVVLDAEKYPAEIRYTTDGTQPTATSQVYTEPVTVRDSAHFVAGVFRDGVLMGKPTEKKVDYHRGIGKPIVYRTPLYPGYMAGGRGALLDGYRGGLTYYDRRWQGYTNSLDCVVDMGEATEISKVYAKFLQLIGPSVFQPGDVELLTSIDGVTFTSRGKVFTTIADTDRMLSFQEYAFNGEWPARYVRLRANNTHPGRGFIFTDEIVIW